MSDAHDKLRTLALAATPGPWRGDSNEIWNITDGGKGYPLDRYTDSTDVVVGQCGECGTHKVGVTHERDAAYIAAASPSVILSLLDQLEQLTRERDEAVQYHESNQAEYSKLAEYQSEAFKEKAAQCERLRERLSAMTAARDELAGIAERLDGGYQDVAARSDRNRIASLRKVGQ